jgi:hypothetical protein
MEPIRLDDLKKRIVVPADVFERTLESLDWTWHHIARGEFPGSFESLEEFQLAIICDDALLWCQSFLREPEDPNHQDPYSFFDYQIESVQFNGNTIHKCGAEVGKTREIIAWCMHKMLTIPNGSGLIGAPQQTHLDEIIESMVDQFRWNPDLATTLVRHKKHPHHAFYLSNNFKVHFRPSGHDGEAYRGVHVGTFAAKDEAAKDKNPRQWSEFWRAMKPGCVAKIYSVPDGDRSCEFYKLGQRALGKGGDLDGTAGKMEFKLFKWGKPMMPAPFWSNERKKFFVDQYGGEDSPGYQHNVLGEDGDPEHTVFPWSQFQHCITDIPEYRALKILVNSSEHAVVVLGYRCPYERVKGVPAGKVVELTDTEYSMHDFFDRDENNESTFTRLIKRFFVSVPGAKRGGADFGFSGDPTEITVKNIIGKKDRLVARLQLKHVTYDQQCQALNALDDIYGPMDSIQWGTDFGNAGSAVAHDLQGLDIYNEKAFDHRLKGFMFESTTDNVNEDGDPLIDAKSGKPSRITLKELATDLLVKKMQKMELEYPPDPDIILYYTNHTVRTGQRHRIFKKDDDHLIDADRTQMLTKVLGEVVEDIFA